MTTALSAPIREKMIAANLAEYGEGAGRLSWVSPEGSLAAEADRGRILDFASTGLEMACKQTKFFWGSLSPGCRICGQGAWSCLFINGKCNCRCFYCPTSQDDISIPTTNRIPFENSRDYVDYIRHFDFRGVSISGGEPLFTFDRTLHYVEAVRREIGESIHIWMYTNGTFVTPQRLKQLRAAGLNEIRFDISAADYDLTRVRMASDEISCVTVEIPAIPEDLEKVSQLLPDLHAAGVRHLNLHQLRLTPFNFSKLSGRNYTFLHGESVTVLESELAALSILESASRENLKLPINYCSFVYKRRYQQAATRRRNALGILKKYESVTENGFIRCLFLEGDPEIIGRQAARLGRDVPDKDTWCLTGKKDRLSFHESLWSKIDFSAGSLKVNYSEAVLSPSVSYLCAFKEVRLNPARNIFVERRPLRTGLLLQSADRRFLEKTIFRPDGDSPESICPVSPDIAEFELIRPGLQDYF